MSCNSVNEIIYSAQCRPKAESEHLCEPLGGTKGLLEWVLRRRRG